MLVRGRSRVTPNVTKCAPAHKPDTSGRLDPKYQALPGSSEGGKPSETGAGRQRMLWVQGRSVLGRVQGDNACSESRGDAFGPQ